MQLTERFWSKVKKGSIDQCWEWIGGLNGGYGSFKYKNKTVGSHRIAYLLSKGDPGDLLVLHSCDNRKCCNPNHLFLGTHLDNSKDKVAKGRNYVPNVKGELNGRAKSSNAQVETWRKLKKDGMSLAEISRRENVPYSRVWGAVSGSRERWGKNENYNIRKGKYKDNFKKNIKLNQNPQTGEFASSSPVGYASEAVSVLENGLKLILEMISEEDDIESLEALGRDQNKFLEAIEILKKSLQDIR